MKVTLLANTEPLAAGSICTSMKELIAYMARVSNPANQTNKEHARLLRYLVENKHWSPFEMVNIVLEIETTRDIARQMLRHHSLSFQEFSQRYAQPGDLGESFETREARMQDETNRQSSHPCLDKSLEAGWQRRQVKVINEAKDAYEWAIGKGIAKEVARAVLPEGLTMTRLCVNGSIRSWIHYLEVRRAPETQKEHRELACAIGDAIVTIFDFNLQPEKRPTHPSD